MESYYYLAATPGERIERAAARVIDVCNRERVAGKYRCLGLVFNDKILRVGEGATVDEVVDEYAGRRK